MSVSGQDIEFLHALGRSLLALTASALALLLTFLLYSQAQRPETAGTSVSRTITGKQMVTRVGTMRVDGSALVVTALQSDNDAGYAVATHSLSIQAQDYPYLTYELKGVHAGLKPYFIWRTAENPDLISSVPLPPNSAKKRTFNLAGQHDWLGNITETGIQVAGNLRGHTLKILELSPAPFTWRNTLLSVWSEWTAFRGWTARSINYLQGTPGQPDSAMLQPTLAMAAWSGLALVFLYGYGAIRTNHQLISYSATILIPWIALDVLWQNELTSQLEQTRYLFSDKNIHEKHLVDEDHHIYSYAKRLKDEVLPPTVSRIFILHNDKGLNYERLKAQYYLLPNNIYNYGRFPPARHIKPGDFILVLGDIPGLAYEESTGRLVWRKKHEVDATLLDQDPLGHLFKVPVSPVALLKTTGTKP